VPNRAFWAMTIAGFAGVATLAAVGIHEVHEDGQHQPVLPGQPALQGEALAPLFR
jgi:hypothetical protein